MLEILALDCSIQKRTILKGITLQARLGKVLSLVGPSGGGKSSLLKAVARLLKFHRGTISFKGSPISELPAYGVGLIFQDFHLFHNLTVLENATLAAIRVKKMSRQQANKRALELLESFQLQNRAHAHPHQISGGEKQRASIIRALMLDPAILLLDEPTSALDPGNIRSVAKLIQKLRAPHRVIMIATHDMHFASQVSDEVAFLHNGLLVEYATASDFFSHPQTEKAKQFIQTIKGSCTLSDRA